jgi:hypothetical protein
MVRTVAAKTRKAIVRAAQDGAEKIRTLAADAASAAAQAAAGVVLTSTTDAFQAGRTQVAQSAPRVKKTLGRAVKRTIGGHRTASRRKHPSKRTAARRKALRKSGAPKRRAKRRSR